MFHGKLDLPSRKLRFAQSTLFTVALLIFIVATRWPLAPRYLYYFDSANFALALEDFNPALHQPQPPGYPLFVGLMRLIHVWVNSAERVQLIAGLLAAFAAVILIRILAADLFGRAAGFLAAALLASDPVFWFSGITNQIRVFLALISVGIASLAWRALTRPDGPVWLYAGFAALGVAAGFRPVETGLLLPLMLWVWYRTGHSLRRLAIAIFALSAATVPWLFAILDVVGGPKRLLGILWDYANVQFAGSSAAFGAPAGSAYRMFLWAVVWNFVGALVWLWAAPLGFRRLLKSGWREKAALLAGVYKI